MQHLQGFKLDTGMVSHKLTATNGKGRLLRNMHRIHVTHFSVSHLRMLSDNNRKSTVTIAWSHACDHETQTPPVSFAENLRLHRRHQ